MLVVVEDRNVEGFLQRLFDLEGARGRDVFEVDPAEGRGETDDGFDDLLWR